MKGDFSRWHFDPAANFSSVLFQQGRVRTDVDDNDGAMIDAHWRETAAHDAFGDGAMVPADAVDSFKIVAAKVVSGQVSVSLNPGRVWADGLLLHLTGKKPTDAPAAYLAPPLQTPQATVASIKPGVRDLVALDVWQESVCAFQEPLNLLEPALGGPDTSERARICAALKLMRLGPNDDCSAIVAAADDFATKGKLTVTPDPAIVIAGDCPVAAAGGYTGTEHYLYRIEIADPIGGVPQFKWSQFNGGLHGRGIFKLGAIAGTGTIAISANDQMINHCGLPSFYLEALERDEIFGTWFVKATADATLPQSGQLTLTNIQGTWPTPDLSDGTIFFRLWNGIKLIIDFPVQANPNALENGIHLAFEAPAVGNTNYTPGDYWTFPVRVAGTPFNPLLWPTKAPPQGVHHRRVALATITWNTGPAAGANDIDDCRHVFQPFPKNKCCCTFSVGDGVRSHGDFDSIEEAVKALPASGGEICLLPGLHQTNTVISGRQHVRIQGCRTKTRVIPRKEKSTDPIFHVLDSTDVAIECMDMVTLGGTAILAESSKPGAVADLEISDNRILACQNAIRVVDGAGVVIHHNRVRMLDKRGSDVAIYLAADDSLIERNDIRLVPAPQMPPIETPDQPDPVDPNDPCARLEIVYVNPLIFMKYVDRVWLLPLLLTPKLVQPYRALSGIQIGGGSERVRVSENVVIGGAGNGITLGDGFTPPAEPPAPPVVTIPISDIKLIGAVVDASNKGVPAAKITLTHQQDGTSVTKTADAGGKFGFALKAGKYAVAASASGLMLDQVELVKVLDRYFELTVKMKAAEPVPQPRAFAFLYQIAIVGNRITAMGMSGIGMPRLTSGISGKVAILSGVEWARVLLGNPVLGLDIRLNLILGCLLNPFDTALQAEAKLHGVGGISLGLCENVSIVENRVEANGTSAANPTCGVFFVYGEGVDISANRIVGNGPLPAGAPPAPLPGIRGGIVLLSVSSFNALGTINAGGTSSNASTALINPRPAARVHENVVDQPVGLALYIAAFGPLSCTDNSFNSELSGSNPLELAAGSVLIINLGGTQIASPSVKYKAGAAQATTGGTDGTAATAEAVSFLRNPDALVLLPRGHTMFSDNQSRTGAANISATCHIIATFDDLAYQDNQSHSARPDGVWSNAFLSAVTIRATGNRFIEVGPKTLLSLFTAGSRMNDTSLNQGDHCIIAVDQNPTMATVQLGNQVLNPSALCPRFQAGALIKYRLQG